MDPTHGKAAARQAGLLFVVAGGLTILNNFVPGSAYLDKAFLNLIGVVCVALGGLVTLLPWGRWPARSSLAISPLAFAIIAVANHRGGVSAYSYAPFFILVFMWVGLHHPARTSYLLAPLAAVAYMVPGFVMANPAEGALSSVTVAIPVCILVGETTARAVGLIRRAEGRFRSGYELLHRSQALAHVGSWEWDPSTGAVEWSPEMYRILGVDPGAGVDTFDTVLSLAVPEHRDRVTARFREVARGDTVAGFSFRIMRPDGARRWIWCQGGPSGEDRPGAVTGFIQDITDRKEVEEELERLALRDELTGLPNRRAFVTVGEQLLRVAERAGETALLLYIDLDNMKAVNDRFGHAAGDQALVEVAGLLRSTFRESDLTARLGGDEFCVLIPRGAGEAGPAIDRLREAVAARQGRFPAVSLSIGAAEAGGSCSIEQLICRADAAMYEEKAARHRVGA